MVQHLEENPELLRQVLKYHVITGTWYSAGLEDSATLLTANGAAINVSLRDGLLLFLRASFYSLILLLEEPREGSLGCI